MGNRLHLDRKTDKTKTKVTVYRTLNSYYQYETGTSAQAEFLIQGRVRSTLNFSIPAPVYIYYFYGKFLNFSLVFVVIRILYCVAKMRRSAARFSAPPSYRSIVFLQKITKSPPQKFPFSLFMLLCKSTRLPHEQEEKNVLADNFTFRRNPHQHGAGWLPYPRDKEQLRNRMELHCRPACFSAVNEINQAKKLALLNKQKPYGTYHTYILRTRYLLCIYHTR